MKELMVIIVTFLKQLTLGELQTAEIRGKALEILLKIYEMPKDQPVTLPSNVQVMPTGDVRMIDRFIKFSDYLTALNYVLHDQKIQAIKFLRELTGYGLKETKDWVDSHMPFVPHKVCYDTYHLTENEDAAIRTILQLNIKDKYHLAANLFCQFTGCMYGVADAAIKNKYPRSF